MTDTGRIVLRLVVGVVFLAHGLTKLLPLGGHDGPAGTAAYLELLGLRPAYALALIAGVFETAGGLALVAGIYARWAAALLSLELVAAIWVAHWQHGFFINWALTPGAGHGFEYHLVMMAALVALALAGPGPASVDTVWRRRVDERAAGRERVRREVTTTGLMS